MENVRPTFLTVLCILTFIGSSWGIYSGITNYYSADMAAGVAGEQFEKIQEQLDNEEGAEGFTRFFQSMGESLTPENIKNSGIASSITSLITLIGAILMWGLRKTGFYVYLVGAIAAIIAPIVILGGVAGIAASGGAAFAGILFVILYALNLKHLR
jgi:hypothetical protein